MDPRMGILDVRIPTVAIGRIVLLARISIIDVSLT